MDQLCDYIVSRHHSYVAENIPFLKQKLQKLCDVHGSHHPELFEINKLFGLVAENLAAHMDKEEQILFPVLRKLAQQLKSGTPDSEEVEKARLSIAELEDEHTAEGERFGEIAKLSNQYTMPPDGCNTFDVTYRTLKEFEQDLHRHIHLESNVLFKKAEAMR
jgi:regulator of cell morphogenesis and NO signaling